MSNIEGKIKEWIDFIQTEKLNEVVKDIQECILEKPNKTVNKHIFKLLLYLSHTADKCNKQKYMIGNQIYATAQLLCSLLTEIPDSSKFVSSLFHIIRCLHTTCMYKEAWEICVYFRSDKLSRTEGNVPEILIKVSYLWHHVSTGKLHALKKNPLHSVYTELKTVVKYELAMIQIAHKCYTKNVLMKLSSYLEEMACISKDPDKYFHDFSVFVIEFLGQIQMYLNKEDKHSICRCMLSIVSTVICRNMKGNSIKSAHDHLSILYEYFKKVLIEDEVCYQSFIQFESTCNAFIKPVEELTSDCSKIIKDYIENQRKMTNKYGYSDTIKWTAFSVAQILELLFTYWETCLKTGKKLFLTNGILLETLNLAVYVSFFFIKQVSDKCKSCHRDECNIRRDIYNAVVIKNRCISLVNKLSGNDLTKDVCTLSIKILEQNVASIYEMKQSNCTCWILLWSNCGTLIYNLGVTSELFYEESARLFSLLCTCIIQFEGLESDCKYIALQNPISTTLHRLCAVHYNQGKYREAMTASALNGLLSYNDPNSKAFRMWANIKHKCSTSKEIIEMCMVTCLKADKSQIEQLGLHIDFSKYNLIKLCLREIKGLQEAKINLSGTIQKVLDMLLKLKAPQIKYTYAVQYLGYHLLSFEYNESVIERFKQTLTNLKQIKTNSASYVCLEANFEFYMFVSQLYEICKKMQIEIESAKFALYAPRLSESGENESRDVVPAYTMINVKEDLRLMTCLQTVLKKWKRSFDLNINEIVKGWEPSLILRMLVIAGEYARLYRYQSCEIESWMLAYKLASELQDYSTIIYVTARSISLKHIDHEWIATAKELATKLKTSDNENMLYAIAIFWISLSNYYIQQGMCDTARSLMDSARKLPGITFVSNPAVYLYSLDRILTDCESYKGNVDHMEYSQYLVEAHYAMLNLSEELSLKKWRCPDKYLFSLDVLLSTSINLSLRMNSLLSFREISAHLVRRLKTSQALGATMRVAEILKSLCYIDLLRTQLNDCEVKLQGLEHILNIETIQLSMNSNTQKSAIIYQISTPTRIVDPVRDIAQNDASPILKNKVFDLPEFMGHSNCNCYSCKNIAYQYMVFACTHIRAQLYALQKQFTAALQHFHGAFQIRKKLDYTEKKDRDCSQDKNLKQYSFWQDFYAVDYILLLLNFSHFLRNEKHLKQTKALDIILLAIQMCKKYNLEGHPIYLSVKETFLDYRFQRTFSGTDYSAFTIPHQCDIDISKYIQQPESEQNICSTPTTNNVRSQKTVTRRRNRTPPLLKLTKVSMNYSDDENNSISSPPIAQKGLKTRTRRLTRRKILNEEYTENLTASDKEESIRPENKLVIKELVYTNKECLEDLSVKEIVNKIAPLVPNISAQLCKLADSFDMPVTNDNLQKLIERIEKFKIDVSTEKKSRSLKSNRQSKPLNCNDYNSRINEVIELFKNINVNESNSFSSDADLPSSNVAESVADIVNICKIQKKCSQDNTNITDTKDSTKVRRSRRRAIK